ncbi:MAG: hypothetical protein D3909_14035, partial [Candidatus Electrothrix sp. ATG1]|nr:hypothetical protein [Candidatus Electrothrix sp. ATG1]
ADRLQPPPEPTDKKALETEKQTEQKIQENKPEPGDQTSPTGGPTAASNKEIPGGDESSQEKGEAEGTEQKKSPASSKGKKKKNASKKKTAKSKKAGKKKGGAGSGAVSRHLKKVTKAVFAGKKRKSPNLLKTKRRKNHRTVN